MKKVTVKSSLYVTFMGIIAVSAILVFIVYQSADHSKLDSHEISPIAQKKYDNSIQTRKTKYYPPPNNLMKSIAKNKDCLKTIPKDHFSKHHLVTPPSGSVTLVCCGTTKGILNVAVHLDWAPNGAKRFLEMVNTDFFESNVPLFRALKGFLVQFGLAGKPELHKAMNSKGWLIDDPSWLPFGPKYREVNGIKRYQKGYMGYAGGGKDSRGTQLIMAFEDNEGLGKS